MIPDRSTYSEICFPLDEVHRGRGVLCTVGWERSSPTQQLVLVSCLNFRRIKFGLSVRRQLPIVQYALSRIGSIRAAVLSPPPSFGQMRRRERIPGYALSGGHPWRSSIVLSHRSGFTDARTRPWLRARSSSAAIAVRSCQANPNSNHAAPCRISRPYPSRPKIGQSPSDKP